MIDYEEDYLFPLLLQYEGSVALRASFYAVPSAILAILLVYMEEIWPGIVGDLGAPDLSGSHIWNAATGVCMLMLVFRTKTAFARFWEGTGLLHQMRGEWFDTVSNCITFSISAKKSKPEEVLCFRHALVRLMSLCHGSALEEIAGDNIEVESIDITGLDWGTLRHLQQCHHVHGFNKVEVMLHLVQSLITKACDDGIIRIPPPIASRVYQTISRGFVNLLNAKKITDTKFPFPYAQLIAYLLFIDLLITPLMISQALRSKVLAALFTFVPVFGMYSLNFIAAELEDPFGTDDNDLPLSHFQEEMNSCLLMLLHPSTDLIAGVSPHCILDFEQLCEAMEIQSDDGSCEARRLSSYEAFKESQETEASLSPVEACPGSPLSPMSPTKLEPLVLPAAGSAPGAEPAGSSSATPVAPPAGSAMEPLSIQHTASNSGAAEPLSVDPPECATTVTTPPLQPIASPELDPLELEALEDAVAEETKRRKQDEAIRLEAAQCEVEKRIGEFYLALQRWMTMIDSQVIQIHDILEVLTVLSREPVPQESGGWESAIPSI